GRIDTSRQFGGRDVTEPVTGHVSIQRPGKGTGAGHDGAGAEEVVVGEIVGEGNHVDQSLHECGAGRSDEEVIAVACVLQAVAFGFGMGDSVGGGASFPARLPLPGIKLYGVGEHGAAPGNVITAPSRQGPAQVDGTWRDIDAAVDT